jgi:hypothetical protein
MKVSKHSYYECVVAKMVDQYCPTYKPTIFLFYYIILINELCFTFLGVCLLWF